MTSRILHLLPGAALCSAILCAQPDQPVRTPPVVKITASAGFRDWSPATIAGSTILAGNQTGAGGLFAVDAATGKVKWSFRPVFNGGTASVSTPPAVSGDVVITPFATAYPGAVIAVSLTTGKQLWRGPDPVLHAAVAVQNGVAIIAGKDGAIYALDAATGRERWKVPLANNLASCYSRPLLRDDHIYLTVIAGQPAGYFLLALDIRTGQEIWRYRAEAPYSHKGVCLQQPILSGHTIYATGESRLYAIHRSTGRDRFPPIEIRRVVEGRVRAVPIHGLVDAGRVLVAVNAGYLIAFDKDSGATAWELPGSYKESSPATAVAGNVLYFQTSSGALNALDLETRSLLWSYQYSKADPNWSFGHVTPIPGGLWVDTSNALLKLQ